MSRHNSHGYSRAGLSRRSILQSAAGLMSVPFIAKATTAWAQEKLAGSGNVVVQSYGGSFTEGVRKQVFDQFTKATGITVVDMPVDTSAPQVKAMNQAGRVDWDTAFIDAVDYPGMQQAGMFEPVDYSLWDAESVEGVQQKDRLSHGVVAFESVTLLAYDTRAFPKGGPKNWAEFWDVKTFPGPRGLISQHGKHNMVYALGADGVPRNEIWPLTDDKIDRALKKLDAIKPHVVKWWVAGGEAPQLLINREYVMTSAYAGRLTPMIRQGAPIRMAWDGANRTAIYWAIIKGGPNTRNAQKLIAFVNRAQIAAGFTLATGYSSPNANQLKHLPADLVPLLSVNPENAAQYVSEDTAWIVQKRPDGKTNADYIQERWLAWKAG